MCLAKAWCIVAFVTISTLAFSQQDGPGENWKDYKDPKQHEKFHKRRKVVAAWQIHELKKGALVVRLKTLAPLIAALSNTGESDLVQKKKLEILAVNLNTSRAYRTNYKFSKVYFIYSHSSDSLMNGQRSGIFLDSSLTIDPNIILQESYYVIAESDKLYNSSIGFVPHDSAQYVTERGNPTGKTYQIVLKNKFGHQVKRPFPRYFHVGGRTHSPLLINIHGKSMPFNVQGVKGFGVDAATYEGKKMILTIPREYVYHKLADAVWELNNELELFYRETPKPDLRYVDPVVLEFLY